MRIHGPKVGFARCDLRGTFPAACSWEDRLEGRVVATIDTYGRFFLIALDVVELSRAVVRSLRTDLAARLKAPVEAVLIHTTHTHASPTSEDFLTTGVGTLARRLLAASEEAIRTAVECDVSLVAARPPERLSIRRRQQLPGAGDMTSFTRFEDVGGYPDALANLRERLARWSPHLVGDVTGMEAFPHDREVDENIQLVCFRNSHGRVIGSILRFAAHPNIVNHAFPSRYSADFPGYARQRVESELGGTALYLNGPNGDIAPWEKVPWTEDHTKRTMGVRLDPAFHFLNSDPEGPGREARRIGSLIADAALGEFRRGPSFKPLASFTVLSRPFTLALRRDIEGADTRRMEKLRECRSKLETLRQRRAGILDFKHLTDEITFLNYIPLFFSGYDYLTPDEASAGTLASTVSAVGWNDILISCLPGEAFLATGAAIRSSLEKKGRRVITAELVNDDLGYLPTPEDIPGGDYEVNCSIIDQRGEPALREAACHLLD